LQPTGIYRSEIAKRFTSEQRAVVFTYLSSSVGKKWRRMLPDIAKAEKEVGEQRIYCTGGPHRRVL
jgi:hypothetical protein